jgi:hypothetical protein
MFVLVGFLVQVVVVPAFGAAAAVVDLVLTTLVRKPPGTRSMKNYTLVVFC